MIKSKFFVIILSFILGFVSPSYVGWIIEDDSDSNRSIRIYFSNKKPSNIPEKEEGNFRQFTLDKLPSEIRNSLDCPKWLKIKEIEFNNADSQSAINAAKDTIEAIGVFDKKFIKLIEFTGENEDELKGFLKEKYKNKKIY